MNDRKIAFIVCTNNEVYYNECVWYIHQLYVPDGYEIDIICITDADSMPQAYNAAMRSSDAKYKVYLHQDSFIYHRDFIKDVVNIFRSNQQCGMLGMIGGINLPSNACIWNAWNQGATYACNGNMALTLIYKQNPNEKWIETEAVDGMMLITQYDIEWREDLELGWDFYDVSQSLEFRRRGYKVGIPYQEKPWCMHDCGPSKLNNYDAVRKKILAEYSDFFSAEYVPLYNQEWLILQEKVFQQMRELIERKDFAHALQIKEKIENLNINNNNLQYALNLLEIYEQECLSHRQGVSFFANIYTWKELKDKYDLIKFAVRHLYNTTNHERVEELMDVIRKGVISEEAVACIAQHSVHIR